MKTASIELIQTGEETDAESVTLGIHNIDRKEDWLVEKGRLIQFEDWMEEQVDEDECQKNQFKKNIASLRTLARHMHTG
jgi:hypothetical protein